VQEITEKHIQESLEIARVNQKAYLNELVTYRLQLKVINMIGLLGN
jgi:hypothetical protein